MKFEDFSFSTKQVGQVGHPAMQVFIYEILITNNVDKVSFGDRIQCQGGPPDNISLFNYFCDKNNFKKFWIEVESEIVLTPKEESITLIS